LFVSIYSQLDFNMHRMCPVKHNHEFKASVKYLAYLIQLILDAHHSMNRIVC